jgi:hypothetical protein
VSRKGGLGVFEKMTPSLLGVEIKLRLRACVQNKTTCLL